MLLSYMDRWNTNHLNTNRSFHELLVVVRMNSLAHEMWVNVFGTCQEGGVKRLILHGVLESAILIPIST